MTAQAAPRRAATGAAATTTGWREDLGAVNIPIALIASLLPVRGVGAFIPLLASLPINVMAAGLLVLVAVWRRPQWSIGSLLLAALAVLLPSWLVFDTVFLLDAHPLRRIASITLVVVFAAVLGQGRLPVKSVAVGALVGLIGNILLAVVTLPASTYTGRITGTLADPNGAGLTIVALGMALGASLRSRPARVVLWCALAVGVTMTWSRTSLFAFGAATLWVLVARRFGRIATLVLLGLLTYAFQWSDRALSGIELFVNRDGSDALRDRLILLENEHVAAGGWLGHGLDTAAVEVQRGITLYYHNSYLALRAEGGLVAYIGLFLLLGTLFLLIHRVPAASRPVWAEAGMVAGFICAINIGYAFTFISFVTALGLFLAYNSQAYQAMRGQVGAAAPTSLLGIASRDPHQEVTAKNGGSSALPLRLGEPTDRKMG